jgi:hypothetical protein
MDGGEWSASRITRFNTGERAPGTHWIGSGWFQRLVEISFLTPVGNQTPAVLLVACRYAD